MFRFLITAAVVAVAVIIYALIDCIRSGGHEVRSISKPAWILTILLVPLLGALLWFLLGRPRGGYQPPVEQTRRPAAPDDDPAFLRNLEAQRRQRARDAELRRREAELKDLEDRLKNQNPDGAQGSTD